MICKCWGFRSCGDYASDCVMEALISGVQIARYRNFSIDTFFNWRSKNIGFVDFKGSTIWGVWMLGFMKVGLECEVPGDRIYRFSEAWI